MKKTLFYGAAAAATMHAHKRYAAVFFVLAVVGIAAAFFTRPKKAYVFESFRCEPWDAINRVPTVGQAGCGE